MRTTQVLIGALMLGLGVSAVADSQRVLGQTPDIHTGPGWLQHTKRSAELFARLNSPSNIKVKGDSEMVPLKEALDRLAKSNGLKIVFDQEALKEANAAHIAEANVQLPALRNIATGTILRDLLSQTEPQARMMLREDHILIVPLGAKTWNRLDKQKVVFTFEKQPLDKCWQIVAAWAGLELTVDAWAEDPVTVELPPMRLLAAADLLAKLGNRRAYRRGGELVVTRQCRLEDVRVDADFRKTPLEEACRELAEQSGFTVMIDPRIGDKAQLGVTARLQDAPLLTSVRLLADMADLKSIALGNVLYMTTRENAQRLEAEHQTPGKKPEKVDPLKLPNGRP